ncbi:sigma-54 dependent transcriptional regulator [Alsobacter sp. SYSU M60028]|uniref:DNA-binding transcriptional regulator NtrC n=1 Tax=Alsobacter ponti TaxID=2962936 RepID=A0ABT1LBL9_9HYPH|nr:sigma-54 dependent transcriptional regulator [Alsobacter ponti]MCP8938854.1 sigma-54 dependent transcriptional regulator [Alsobacter ponti]
MSSTILIVDDDPIQRRLLENTVQRLGYQAVLAEGGEAAMQALTGPTGGRIDLVILDLVMPDLDGMGVLGRLRALGRMPPVVVQTAHGSIETVISAMRAGASDFVVKPVGVERLAISIKNALKAGALEEEIRLFKRHATGTLGFADLASRSPEMTRAIRLAERACKSHIPVLIEGESGVGKELLARAIQGSSDRRGKAFVTVNCAAIPENLVESVLFGHEKGAFTGATERHVGKFVEAHGGTLFLDEIGELPPEAQAKLLRAIQEGEVDPVGGRRPVRVDIRLISATNQNLIELVKQGRFREDLFYRLNVFPITLPPLRARREDIPELARRFTARFAAEEGKRVRGVSAELSALLTAYDWPGNIRQLENAVFRAVVMCDGDELTVAEFPQIASRVEGFEVRVPALPAARAPEPPRYMAAPREMELRDPSSLRLLGEDGHVRSLAALEEEAIRFALQHYRSHMTEMARRLGIGRSTLYRKMKDLGLAEAENAA